MTRIQKLSDVVTQQIEDVQKAMESDRKDLAENVPNWAVHTIVAAANVLANLEGQFKVWYGAGHHLAYFAKNDSEITYETATMKIFKELALRGNPDDGWSGRANDSRRSEYDGYRRALELLSYEMEKI